MYHYNKLLKNFLWNKDLPAEILFTANITNAIREEYSYNAFSVCMHALPVDMNRFLPEKWCKPVLTKA